MLSPEEVERLVEAECEQAIYIPLAEVLAPYRVRPQMRMLDYFYDSSVRYPCWVIAEVGSVVPHWGLAYFDYHRTDRWGIVLDTLDWFGRDDCCYSLLEDAVISVAGLWNGPLPEDYEVR